MNEAEFFNVELDESLKAGGEKGAVTFSVGNGSMQNPTFCQENDIVYLWKKYIIKKDYR